jgi:hypothetical protein
MSKLQLERAIETVNKRYSNGLNDDDQLARMCAIDLKTKGHSFMPLYDSYELCTDEEIYQRNVKMYGNNKQLMLSLKDKMIKKGGYEYWVEMNTLKINP